MTCPKSFRNHFWEYYDFYALRQCMKCGLRENYLPKKKKAISSTAKTSERLKGQPC